jgi:hypothetical protein
MRWRVPTQRGKYGNIRSNGFDSQKECARYAELQLLELAGQIEELKRQVTFTLSKEPKCSYRADFVYREGGQTVVEDVKGFVTPTARVKLAWFQQRYPELLLKIT